MKKAVSVIIPLFNNSEHLCVLLESLEKQTFPLSDFEVIIVDDGSSDNASEVIDAYKRKSQLNLRYYKQANKGPASARNKGVGLSEGGKLIFIDSDCTADPNLILSHYNNLEWDGLSAVGGICNGVSDDSLISSYCETVAMNRIPPVGSGGVRYVMTSNCSCLRDAFFDVGGFCEVFEWPGGEDYDFSLRLKAAGYRIGIDDKAVVFSSYKKNLYSILRSFFCYGKGESIVVDRHFFKKSKCWSVVRICSSWISFFASLLYTPIFHFSFFYGVKDLCIGKAVVFSFYEYVKEIAFALGFRFGDILCLLGFYKAVSFSGGQDEL